MGCDLCGKEGVMFQVRIEGTVMTVCSSCKEYGEVIRRLPTQQETKREAKRKPEERTPTTMGGAQGGPRETLLLVVPDYGARVKKARERLGLKQEELAKRLRIKESQLHTYESGMRKPDLETARQLERALRITLVEEHVEEGSSTAARASGPVTIADLLKKK